VKQKPSDSNDTASAAQTDAAVSLDSWVEAAPLGALRLRPPPRWHGAAERLLRYAAFASVAAIILIFLFVLKESLPLFFSEDIQNEVSPRTMLSAQWWDGYSGPVHVWQPVSAQPKYSIWPLVVGSLKITFVAVLLAVPVSVGAAVYVTQFAPARVREVVKPAIELLASIPSVVLGFFALMVMASAFQSWFGLDSRLNGFVAGSALAIAVVPVVFTICEDALMAVPQSFKDASAALGAARWQTTLFVVTPAAAPGLLVGVALGFGRAVGETMIVLMASGNAALLSLDVTDSARTVSATIAAELAEVIFGGAHYSVLFFLGLLLFLITAVINLAGELAINRMRRRLRGQADG